MSPPPVQTEIGKYRLLRKLATGGMAEVYLAQAAGPAGFQKTLVLKRILPHLAEDQAFVEMFLNEARLAALLNHPNVVQIFDLGEADGSYFIAMEHIDGPNLRALCRRAAELGRSVPAEHAAKIIAFACEGLGYAHDFSDNGQPLNLIHRDISPDNVLISRTGAVKVVDFGIAKAANQGHLTKTGTLKGKLAYMPPEQLRGKPLDRRADIFSLGVVLYELLAGMKPFDATSEIAAMQAILHDPPTPLDERRPDCPAELVVIVERALEKERENRYPDCRAMQRDLEQFLMARRKTVGAYELAQLVSELIPPTPIPIQHTPLPAVLRTPAPAPRTPSRETPIVDSASETLRVPKNQLPGAPPPPPLGQVTQTVPAAPADGGAPAGHGDETFADLRPPRRSFAGLLWGGVGLFGLAAAAALYFLVIAPRIGPSVEPQPTPVAKPGPTPEQKRLEDEQRKADEAKAEDDRKKAAAAAAAAAEEEKRKVEEAKAADEKKKADEAKAAEDKKRADQDKKLAKHPGKKDNPHVATPTPLAPDRPEPPKDSKLPGPTVAMADKPAALIVDSDPACSVQLDGKPVGLTPVEIRPVVPGGHQVVLTNREKNLSRTLSVNVNPQEEHREKVKFGSGSIVFRVMPWAFVELDGKQMGQTPIAEAVVYEGEHRVHLSNPELKKDKVVQVQVRAGAKEVVKVNFDAE